MGQQVTQIPPTHATGTFYVSQAAEDTKSVYAGKAMVTRIAVANANAAARFIWAWDSTAASGTIILAGIPVSAAGFAEKAFPFGRAVATGLFVALSTTQKTYTATGGTDGVFDVDYAKRDVWP
jgi:hypothetical protein